MSHAKMWDVPKMDNYDGRMLETGLIRDHHCACKLVGGGPAEWREKLSLALGAWRGPRFGLAGALAELGGKLR